MTNLTRNSTRSFSDKQVNLDTLKSIISEAQQAPSWENSQPYHVFLATGDTAAKIRAAHEKNVNNKTKSWTEVVPPQTWTPAADANILDWQYQASNHPESKEFGGLNTTLFNAPAIVYITIKKDASNYVAYDAGAFGYGMLLAAQNHGLGAMPAYGFVRYPEEIHEYFEIPEDEAIFMGIGLGYASEDEINQFRPGRNDLDKILQIKG
ncbi:nitroreductase [Companilactobacillus ginsenosidimutans]|uniref:Nitroreductase n=1 Tax=Companilactobacillus ginsenosidimutans TaxID=1007676 RepID=A0A0H4R0I1_9LACO|nr:nitroreductase [Companilactobacillus ginsenosidimutans]AKP67230.1 nitroreductase [Companilactobacillus ginsenosidimutans]